MLRKNTAPRETDRMTQIPLLPWEIVAHGTKSHGAERMPEAQRSVYRLICALGAFRDWLGSGNASRPAFRSPSRTWSSSAGSE